MAPWRPGLARVTLSDPSSESEPQPTAESLPLLVWGWAGGCNTCPSFPRPPAQAGLKQSGTGLGSALWHRQPKQGRPLWEKPRLFCSSPGLAPSQGCSPRLRSRGLRLAGDVGVWPQGSGCNGCPDLGLLLSPWACRPWGRLPRCMRELGLQGRLVHRGETGLGHPRKAGAQVQLPASDKHLPSALF